MHRRREEPGPSSPLRFAIVVPAHDEEPAIARTVRSLLEQDYPAERFRVVVVADNCSDGTAEAAAGAGAEVMVRTDPDHRAKGYALDFAFQHLTADPVDACVVVDADSTLTPGSLHAFQRAIESGAMAIQGRYGVANPRSSWRTLLMAVAFGAFNHVRSLGRERLSLSCGLKGNAMCFTTGLLRDHPYTAHGLVEDAEYTIQLARAGIRVRYEEDAGVTGEMPATGAAARSQRIRWESGRALLCKQHARDLILDAVKTRDSVLLDLGLDLVVPPLSHVALMLLISMGLNLLFVPWNQSVPWVTWSGLVAIALLLFHVLRGWYFSSTGIAGLAALALAPVYVGWKMIATMGRSSRSWVRTQREAGSGR